MRRHGRRARQLVILYAVVDALRQGEPNPTARRFWPSAEAEHRVDEGGEHVAVRQHGPTAEHGPHEQHPQPPVFLTALKNCQRVGLSSLTFLPRCRSYSIARAMRT